MGASVSRSDIEQSAQRLRAGDIVGIPTETVYGLAADATNDIAIAKIFEAKRRPRFNPLIVHVATMEAAWDHVEFNPMAERIAEALWPGPVTLVLPRRPLSPLSLLVSAGLDSIAIRSPHHPMARDLIAALGRPLAAPSANISGQISPTTAAHVRDSFGAKIAGVLDGGPCAIGVESTIVKVDGAQVTVLRPGGVSREELTAVVGDAITDPSSPAVGKTAVIEAPGMMTSHYAPSVPLRLNIASPEPDEAFLAFGPTPDHPHMRNLSATGDLREAAAHLFSHLRTLDALCVKNGLRGIAAAPIPTHGLGEAIFDRLTRAAAPKET